jgi:hypothetical protein
MTNPTCGKRGGMPHSVYQGPRRYVQNGVGASNEPRAVQNDRRDIGRSGRVRCGDLGATMTPMVRTETRAETGAWRSSILGAGTA